MLHPGINSQDDMSGSVANNHLNDKTELNDLKSQLTKTLVELVQAEHHRQQMSEAIKTNKSPFGLTPKLKMTAMAQIKDLTKTWTKSSNRRGYKS